MQLLQSSKQRVTFVQGVRYGEQLSANEVTSLPDTNIFLLLPDGHFQLLEANNPNDTRYFPAI